MFDREGKLTFGQAEDTRQVELNKMVTRNRELLRSFAREGIGCRSSTIAAAMVHEDQVIITFPFNLVLPGLSQKGAGGKPFYVKFRDGAFRVQRPEHTEDDVSIRVDIRECLELLPEGHELVQVEVFRHAHVLNGKTGRLQVLPRAAYAFRVYDRELKTWDTLDPDDCRPTNGPPILLPWPSGRGIPDRDLAKIHYHALKHSWPLMVPHVWSDFGWVKSEIPENMIAKTPEEAIDPDKRAYLFGLQSLLAQQIGPFSHNVIRQINMVMARARGKMLAEAEEKRRLRKAMESRAPAASDLPAPSDADPSMNVRKEIPATPPRP